MRPIRSLADTFGRWRRLSWVAAALFHREALRIGFTRLLPHKRTSSRWRNEVKYTGVRSDTVRFTRVQIEQPDVLVNRSVESGTAVGEAR